MTKTLLQAQTYEWLAEHSNLATHAITLTYNQPKVYGFLKAFSDGSTSKSKAMLERYVSGMSRFSNALDRKLFGHSSKRHGQKLFFVPVLEGFTADKFPHWHCVIGVPGDRSSRVESVVQEEWKNVPFGGLTNVKSVFSSKEWLDYITKCARYPDRQSVAWDSVRIPITATLN